MARALRELRELREPRSSGDGLLMWRFDTSGPVRTTAAVDHDLAPWREKEVEGRAGRGGRGASVPVMAGSGHVGIK